MHHNHKILSSYSSRDNIWSYARVIVKGSVSNGAIKTGTGEDKLERDRT